MMVSGKTAGSFNLYSLLTFYLFLLIVLDISVNEGSEAALTPTAVSIHLEVSYACDSTAALSWITQDSSDNQVLQKCELTYYPTEKTSAQILDIFLDSHAHTINLFNLSQGESYTAFIVCGDSFQTNKVTFYSDSLCEGKNAVLNHTFASSETEKNITPSYSHASSFDVVEWPIAVTFVVVGVIIGAVVAFYMWKKYQRRQRILRIFRQGQNDPFQALYSPTQDSYSF